MEPVLRMENITKKFGDLIANNRINLDLYCGEILCLLGENGAGKTTLMNILYGMWQPDEGSIYLMNKLVYLRSPRDAIRKKIGMVSQHFSLIPTITVHENITIGNIPTINSTPFLDARKSKEKSKELAESCGFGINIDSNVELLSVGEQQRVEILKALYQGAEILILDEPTAVLTSQESEELFKIIRIMTKQNKSVIFITHKMKEALNCDRIIALRSGKVVFEKKVSDVSIEKLTEAMFGKSSDVSGQYKKEIKEANPVLELKNINAKDERGLSVLKDISFCIHEGEIFGVAGVAGNGQRELAEVIAGLYKNTEGRIYFKGKDFTNYSTKARRKNGIAHIPEERHKNGVVVDLPIYLNLILSMEDRRPFSNKSILNYSEILKFTKAMEKDFEIKMSGSSMLVRYLSGGNMQKLILAREFSTSPELIIASQPTRGLDIKTTNFVREKLIEERNNGKAILLISYDLDEIFALSDKIGVIFEGSMTIIDMKNTKRREIEKMMLGIKIIENETKAING
ncbi:MAG: ABC transporter ATP-binding protein [Actinobacteria bacterium]|nr:ABC transporter ATP-binding protein [Actinomycetota bacterium]